MLYVLQGISFCFCCCFHVLRVLVFVYVHIYIYIYIYIYACVCIYEFDICKGYNLAAAASMLFLPSCFWMFAHSYECKMVALTYTHNDTYIPTYLSYTHVPSKGFTTAHLQTCEMVLLLHTHMYICMHIYMYIYIIHILYIYIYIYIHIHKFVCIFIYSSMHTYKIHSRTYLFERVCNCIGMFTHGSFQKFAFASQTVTQHLVLSFDLAQLLAQLYVFIVICMYQFMQLYVFIVICMYLFISICIVICIQV
jgi:hypothetical protein